MQETLISYGFTERQAAIYLYLLEQHDRPAYVIATETRIPRATVYKILDELKKQGLISSWIKNGVRHFSAESPEFLRRALIKKQELIDKALPDMLSLFKSDVIYPAAKLYEGKEGVKQVFENMLDIIRTRKLKRIYAYSDNSLTEQFPVFFREWRTRKNKSSGGAFTHLIVPYGTQLNKDYFSDEFRETRVMTRSFPIDGTIDICGSYVAFFSFKKGNIFAVTIDSEIISDLLTKFFQYIWETLEPGR
jgi:hypothetical protein